MALAKVVTLVLAPKVNMEDAAAAFVPPFVCMMAPVRLKLWPKPLFWVVWFNETSVPLPVRLMVVPPAV